MGVYEKAKQLLRIIALQQEWIGLAKLYIAMLETERRNHER